MKILIVDDHQLFAQSLQSVLEQAGMGAVETATTARDGLQAALSSRPDVVLVDLILPDRDGVALGREIAERVPDARVVALTAVNDAGAVKESIVAGFSGYVTKEAPISQLVHSIQVAAGGQLVFPRRVAGQITGGSPEERQASFLAQQLTPREREVLAMLVEGTAQREIADELSISSNTVRTHIYNIRGKLQVSSRLAAVALAVKHGIVKTQRKRQAW
jgi:NarL family two-component system response regulator LiaR